MESFPNKEFETASVRNILTTLLPSSKCRVSPSLFQILTFNNIHLRDLFFPVPRHQSFFGQILISSTLLKIPEEQVMSLLESTKGVPYPKSTFLYFQSPLRYRPPSLLKRVYLFPTTIYSRPWRRPYSRLCGREVLPIEIKRTLCH